MGAWHEKNPYLLAVALSVGLPVSIGSEELSSLELRAKKMREDQNVSMFINMQSNFNNSAKIRFFTSLYLKKTLSQCTAIEKESVNYRQTFKKKKKKSYTHNAIRTWNCE